MAKLGKMMKVDESLTAIPLLPVGTVYQTIDIDFNPNEYFHGFWEKTRSTNPDWIGLYTWVRKG